MINDPADRLPDFLSNDEGDKVFEHSTRMLRSRSYSSSGGFTFENRLHDAVRESD